MTEEADAPRVARRMTLKLKTPDIQGEDSWVEVIPFVVEERFSLPKAFDRREMLKQRVTGWNWVDEKGKALAQPGDEPDIFNRLTTFELSALSDVVLGFPGLDDLKN